MVMNYAKFAIIFWFIATIIIAIVGRKSFLKTFGLPQNKIVKIDWRAYLFCAMILGATISIGITFIIKSFS
jgi:membrane protease YdiL (CAAX protease family)